MSITVCRVMPYAFVAMAFLGFNAAYAQSPEPVGEQLDWLQLGMGLFGGLALFLAGLDVLSEGLKKAAGDTLRDVLQKLTVNRFMGAATGAFVTTPRLFCMKYPSRILARTALTISCSFSFKTRTASFSSF